MLFSCFKWTKIIIAAVYETISEKAKAANVTVKQYIGDEKNIDHISLVIYDVLPLAIKLGYRYDNFSLWFKKHFKSFRDKIYTYDEEVHQVMNSEANAEPTQPEEKPKKPKSVKSSASATKKVAAKRATKTSSVNEIKSSDKSKRTRKTKTIEQ